MLCLIVYRLACLLTDNSDAGSSPTWPDSFFNDVPLQNNASRLLTLVEEYSRNKNTLERTIDLKDYLVIFIRDVSTELGHFQTVMQK